MDEYEYILIAPGGMVSIFSEGLEDWFCGYLKRDDVLHHVYVICLTSLKHAATRHHDLVPGIPDDNIKKL